MGQENIHRLSDAILKMPVALGKARSRCRRKNNKNTGASANRNSIKAWTNVQNAQGTSPGGADTLWVRESLDEPCLSKTVTGLKPGNWGPLTASRMLASVVSRYRDRQILGGKKMASGNKLAYTLGSCVPLVTTLASDESGIDEMLRQGIIERANSPYNARH